jgi:hypothetical protein
MRMTVLKSLCCTPDGKTLWKPLRKRDKLRGKLVRMFDTHLSMYDDADTSNTPSLVDA